MQIPFIGRKNAKQLWKWHILMKSSIFLGHTFTTVNALFGSHGTFRGLCFFFCFCFLRNKQCWEQTEVRQTVMPLYLFQVSAHSRPVALQRKPRYSTLAKRKGRGYFRDRFKVNTNTTFFFVIIIFFFSLRDARAEPGWPQQILRWRWTVVLRAHQKPHVFIFPTFFRHEAKQIMK